MIDDDYDGDGDVRWRFLAAVSSSAVSVEVATVGTANETGTAIVDPAAANSVDPDDTAGVEVADTGISRAEGADVDNVATGTITPFWFRRSNNAVKFEFIVDSIFFISFCID